MSNQQGSENNNAPTSPPPIYDPEVAAFLAGNFHGPGSESDDGLGGGAPVHGGPHAMADIMNSFNDIGIMMGDWFEPNHLDNLDAALESSEDESQQEQELTVAQRIRPVTNGWIKPNGQYDEGETFFPLPLVTFAIDMLDNITCRLCRVSELRVVPSGVPRGAPQPPPTDNTPAILPCGHVFGALCIAATMEDAEFGEWSCPFCRLHLVHPHCGHRVKERVLTARTITALPPTLPMGGKIAKVCPDCRNNALQAKTDNIVEVNMQGFKDAREKYTGAPDEALAVFMMERMEQIRKVCDKEIEDELRTEARSARFW